MAIGESADFMAAEVESDKTYYTLVTPRMGMWKARFSLKPISENELNSEKFRDWLKDCDWVEKTLESDQWASENMDSILKKYKKYYPKWQGKEDNERPRLHIADGLLVNHKSEK